MLSEVLLQLVDDFRGAHERQSVVVDAHVDAELEVQPVLVCDGRQIGALAADVQVPPESKKPSRSIRQGVHVLPCSNPQDTLI